MKTVSIHIVTFNSVDYINDCLVGVFRQTYPIEQVIVVDNASNDGTIEIVSKWSDKVHLVQNSVNNGFAGGHNQAIRQTETDYCLILNPDVVLEPGYIQNLLRVIVDNPLAGSATGKLLFKANPTLIDSTGLIINRARRAFDRGAHQPSDTYQQAEEVFGVSGAAAFYSRDMIDDISVNGEFFDEDFFAYKEDVDVAWRAQLLGWKAYFEPSAIAFHERGWKEGGRSAKPLFVRRLSYINRYKMMLKNDRFSDAVKHFIPLLGYELLSLGYALVREPKLLGAWLDFIRKLPELRAKRSIIQKKRKASIHEVNKWFGK
ncbi:glycosyltransferase family 2 protein [Paenibacillus sp. SYP-B3998]|uniref:Glycosyltransferase family 2 protein n=1 Tax=Paenibacillus sp. SYP-B3998 TaxID=2678564 RepID=A0A6G3ZY01_9BACL|nr:glycosyltransferase family 2 protein [Paenibacillus sp. SYP-B3998]NEW07096.1 glycosyltransferase family 2 protein [Paenibacillus sp. SYP-B3998]